jgi:hypothetical protein
VFDWLGETDENFNYGLRKLIEILQNIIAQGPTYVPIHDHSGDCDHQCPNCGHWF